MNELKPFLDEDPTSDEAALLRSACDDAPRPPGRRRALAALGLAAGLGTASGTSSAIAAATVPGLLVKGAAVAVGVAVVGAVAVWHSPRSVSVSPVHPALSALAPAPPPNALPRPRAVEPLPSSTETDPARPASPSAPVVAAVSPSAAPPVPAPARSMASPAGLSQELEVLSTVRAALARSDPEDALRELDAYELRFAPARLAPEAAVLRVEALVGLGRMAEARRVADGVRSTEAGRAYARRLRSVLGDSTKSGTSP